MAWSGDVLSIVAPRKGFETNSSTSSINLALFRTVAGAQCQQTVDLYIYIHLKSQPIFIITTCTKTRGA